MNVRFPERTFQHGWHDPENPVQYPMGELPNALECDLVNPTPGKSHGLAAPMSVTDERFYAQEALPFIAVRSAVLAGRHPFDQLKPLAWGNAMAGQMNMEGLKAGPLGHAPLDLDDPMSCAYAVRMDRAVDYAACVYDYCVAKGFETRNADLRYDDFHRRAVRPWTITSSLVDQAMDMGWEEKYFFGRPRPIEVLTNEPLWLPEEFVASGSTPKHPSYPANHSTNAKAAARAAGRSFIIPLEEVEPIRVSYFMWGMFRSYLGVHWLSDNIAGYRVLGPNTLESFASGA